MKTLIALIPALVLMACTVQPSVQPLVSEAPESKGLNRVEKSGFDTFFIHKDTKDADYHAIMFDELQVDMVTIDNRRLDFGDRDWELTDKDKARWQEMFRDRVEDAFSKSKTLQLTDTAAQGVLKAEMAFISFTPSATKDDLHSRVNLQRVFTQSVGKLDIKIVIKDALTGKQLAYIEDSREVGDVFYPSLERNDRINNDRKMRLELLSWLNLLKSNLSELAG